MARIPMYDPLTSEARSPLIAGLTEACSKLSSILDLHIEEAYDMPLSPIFVTEDDKYRIYQSPLGNKLWMESPPPVIRQNGVVITPAENEFSIDYFGGSIVFDNNKQLTEFDNITADFTYIVEGSNTIEQIIYELNNIGVNANKFRGYYDDVTSAVSTITNPVGGDFFVVGGEENNIYIWNSTQKKWNPVHKEADLSDYYTKLETDGLLSKKEDTILVHGNSPEDDNYYYGGRKQWVNINEKVKDSDLAGIDTSNSDKVTEDDNVLSAVGKLQGQIDNFVHDMFGDANPTTETVGKIGQDYTNTSTGAKFHLTEISTSGEYIWTAYQDELDLDTTPTLGSELPVTSDGIYKALQGKTDKVIPITPGNLAVLDENGNIIDSGKGVEEVGRNLDLHEVTLTVSGWTNSAIPFVQTVSVENVIENNWKQLVTVSVYPDDENISAIMNCGIYCTGQGNGTLTFIAFEDMPTKDVRFNVVLQNV